MGIFPDAQGQLTPQSLVRSARMRMIKSKMKELECSQDFSQYKSMGFFPDAQGQLTPQSLVRSGRIFNLIRDVIDVLITCKYEEDPIKNEGARVFTTFSPLYSYGSYWLPWTPEVRSDLVQNLMHPSPLPKDASDKIWLRLAHWLRRYSSLKMFTDRQTHSQTDRRIDWYTISSP